MALQLSFPVVPEDSILWLPDMDLTAVVISHVNAALLIALGVVCR
ncbi:MAG TPA: hypothetical protein VF766_14895 [Pyrinomonadaceae bacterium]